MATGDRTLTQAILDGEISLDDALTAYRPPTGGERAQTFVSILGRAARDAYMSGTSAELRIAERGLSMIGADGAAEWMRGFADYVAPGGGFAEDVSQAGFDILPEVPAAAANEQSAVARAFTQLLPEGLGSSVGILALPGLKGARGVALRGSLVGAGQQFVEAKAHGAEDDDAWMAFLGGAGLGATDALSPLGRLLGRADSATGGMLRRLVWEGVIKGGAEEATQETLQTIGENLLAQVLYDEDRAVIENVLDAGEGGALTGMLLGALVGARAHGGAGGPQAAPGGQPEAAGPGEARAAAEPPTAIQAPDEDVAALGRDLGAETFYEAPEPLRRAAEGLGARVVLARGEGGGALRRPGGYLRGAIVVDAANPERLIDHEVGHAAFARDEEGSAILRAAIEQARPGLLEAAREDYRQDELAAMRRNLNRELTAEEEASVQVPDDEGLARVFEDFGFIARNLDKFAAVEDVGFWRRMLRAVMDVGRRLTGRPVPDRLEARWQELGGSSLVTREQGLAVAQEVGAYLRSLEGRARQLAAPRAEAQQAEARAEQPAGGEEAVQAAEPAQQPRAGPLPIPEPSGDEVVNPVLRANPLDRRLLGVSGAELDARIAARLAAEDAALREQFPGRGEAWYARAADLRRQARDPLNAEGDRAALQLRRAGVRPLAPDPWSTETLMRARAIQRRPGGVRTVQPGEVETLGAEPRYAAERRDDADAAIDRVVRVNQGLQKATDAELEEAIKAPKGGLQVELRRLVAVIERAKRTGDTAALNEIRSILDNDQRRYAVWRRALPTNGTTHMPWDVRDAILRYAQDSWRGPGRWRDALAAAGRVTDANDIILMETLRRGGTLKAIQDETANYVAPLRESIARGPVSLNDAGRYLLARAAPDRNRMILARGGPADGSGFSDAEAERITRAAETGPHAAKYAEIADLFDKLTNRKLDLMVQYGLITQERADELRAQEPRYAPMKSDPVEVLLYGEEGRGTQRGIGRTRRREFRAATGRGSEADNPFIHATMDLNSAIERGMWNATTGRATLEMAREFSDPNIATVDVQPTQRTVRNGQIVEVPALERSNEVVVKENGVPRVVRFGRGWEVVAEAIKGADRQQGDAVLGVIRQATRVLAGLSTRWNLAFQPVNFVRDAANAYLNASAEFGARAAADMVSPRRVAWAVKELKDNGPWAERFRNAGAPVAFLDLARTFEEEAARTVREIRRLQSPNSPWELPRRAAANVMGFLDEVGRISENASRLAAFRYAIEEQGASDARAAEYAKNLTTNFERRGANQWMSALFAFSNAGVQGTARVGQALRTPWGQRAAAALVAGGFLLSYMNRITGGDDDDGVPRWDKIPDWQRRSNIILMAGDQKVMFPAPFVWNIFHALGTEIERAAFGGQTPLESTRAIGATVANAINPLGGEADVVDTITPTLADPLVQAVRNRDYAGRRIYPDFDKGPDYLKAWDNTSPTSVKLAEMLSNMSGGDPGVPGLVDVSPAQLEFIFKQYLGGVGGESSRILRLAEKMISGEEIEKQDVPAFRRFFGSLGLMEQRDYYKRRREMIEAQVRREEAGEPYDERLWRLRTRARRWDERIRSLEREARAASGEERNAIRARLRAEIVGATEEIEEAMR